MLKSKKKKKKPLNFLYKWDRDFFEDCFDLGVLVGVDEAGRGAIAGPVVAGAVVLDYASSIGSDMQLNDSKLLSPKERQVLYHQICHNTFGIGIGSVDQEQIDEINILEASKRAMLIALQNLEKNLKKSLDESLDERLGKNLEKNRDKPFRRKIDLIVSDAVMIPGAPAKVKPIIRGDQKSACIAAASIVAKVSRDAIMHALDRVYPAYHWYKNKGYPTPYHKSMLQKKGITPVHRKTFAPVRLLIQSMGPLE